MKKVSLESVNSFIGIFAIVFILTVLFINYIKGVKENFEPYRGVDRWGQNYYKDWKGSEQYPVSINCNCPNNYKFVDTKCVNRSHPFNVVEPDCYNN